MEELDEGLPPIPSTHGTFGEEEEVARRDKSGELVVNDTASFLPDSYTENESAHSQDEEEDADGIEEGGEEKEEEWEEEAHKQAWMTRSPTTSTVSAGSSIPALTPITHTSRMSASTTANRCPCFWRTCVVDTRCELWQWLADTD